MDYIYAELNDDIRDTYYTGYLSGSSDEESIGVVVNIDNQTHKISADLSEATKELLATHGDEIVRVEGRLDDEIARAKAAEEQLGSDLEHEVARAQAEEASLSRRLSDLKSETSFLATELTNESEVRLREDVVLTNKLTAEVQRAEAEESRIETTLRAALVTAESNLSNRIAGEELARITADNNLNVSIENVNAQLTNKIEGEASERALAIEGVTAQLAAEGDTRRAEDNSIRTLIQEEAAISRSEESKLSTQINNAVAGLQSEDAKIRASLSEELMARIEADRDLSASLSAETADRKAIDTATIERLDTAEDDIDVLEGRATAAEGRLDAIEGDDGLIASGDAATLEAAKSYTDNRETLIRSELKTAYESYTDNAVATEEAARKAEDIRLADLIDNNADAVATEATTREDADTALDGRLDVIEGTGEGSVKKALQDAKDYVDGLFGTQDTRDDGQDALIAANKVTIEKEVADREAAISGVVSDYEAAVQTLNTKDTELAGLISDNTATINKEIEDRVDAVKTVSDKVDVEKVSTAIATAKSEAITAAKSETDGQVSALTEKVNKNTLDISTLSNTVSSEISRVEGLVTAEETRAKGVEAGFEGRITEMEVFFKEEKVDGALNTLYEIQDYINTHGDAVDQMVGNINTNTANINTNTANIAGLSDRMSTAEGDIDALEAKDTELNTAIGTKLAIDTFNIWKASHETDHAKTATAITTEITTAVDGEKILREAADAAINEKFGAAYSKDATIASAIADAKKAGTDADAKAANNASRLDVVEPKVTTLQEIVDGYSAKGSIKTAVEAAQTAANTAQAAANAAQGEVDTLEGTVGTLRGEYNVTKALATANETEINTLKGRVSTAEGSITTLETASAKHADKTYVDAELAKKVNVTDYTTAIGSVYTKTEADDKFGPKTTVEKNTTDIGTNASNITTLTGRLTTAEGDIGTIEADLSNYKKSVTTALAGKQDIITENTYDTYGSAAIVKAYVDGDFKAAIESDATNKANAAQAAAEQTAANTYLPKSGGTITGNSGDTPLNLKSAHPTASYVGFQNTSGTILGYFGYSSNDTPAVYLNSGGAKTIYHTGNLPTIPTKTSQLTNDSGFITAASAGAVSSVNGRTGDVTGLAEKEDLYGLYDLKFFSDLDDIYDAVIVDPKLAALAKSGLPNGFTLRVIISYSTDLITVKSLVLRFLEAEDNANYEAASRFPVCLATGPAVETNQYSTNTVLLLVFNATTNSFYIMGDFGLEAEVEKLTGAAHPFLASADLSGETHFKTAGTWSYISAENGIPTTHPFKLIVRGPHMAIVPTADGTDMIWQFWYYATVLDSVGDQYVQTFQINTLQSEIEKLDEETLSNLDFTDIPKLGIGTNVKSEWKQIVTTPDTPPLHFNLKDDNLTGITISSKYDRPLIAASYRDSTAFELVVDPEAAGSHLYLGIDAPCDILLSEDAGQVGQVLTSAGPNATPYWSSEYVSLSSVLPYLASFTPDVNYTSVTQLYKILGIETEFDDGDYDFSDRKEIGDSQDYIDSSAIFYTPGAVWPSSFGISHELKQLLKTKPCIFTSHQSDPDRKGSILVYRESIQADYGSGIQPYDLWDKYDYNSQYATWSHDNTTAAGNITIATNSIVTNPIYKQLTSAFAYDSSTKTLIIS